MPNGQNRQSGTSLNSFRGHRTGRCRVWESHHRTICTKLAVRFVTRLLRLLWKNRRVPFWDQIPIIWLRLCRNGFQKGTIHSHEPRGWSPLYGP
jgi:hypothetical protein